MPCIKEIEIEFVLIQYNRVIKISRKYGKEKSQTHILLKIIETTCIIIEKKENEKVFEFPSAGFSSPLLKY